MGALDAFASAAQASVSSTSQEFAAMLSKSDEIVGISSAKHDHGFAAILSPKSSRTIVIDYCGEEQASLGDSSQALQPSQSPQHSESRPRVVGLRSLEYVVRLAKAMQWASCSKLARRGGPLLCHRPPIYADSSSGSGSSGSGNPSSAVDSSQLRLGAQLASCGIVAQSSLPPPCFVKTNLHHGGRQHSNGELVKNDRDNVVKVGLGRFHDLKIEIACIDTRVCIELVVVLMSLDELSAAKGATLVRTSDVVVCGKLRNAKLLINEASPGVHCVKLCFRRPGLFLVYPLLRQVEEAPAAATAPSRNTTSSIYSSSSNNGITGGISGGTGGGDNNDEQPQPPPQCWWSPRKPLSIIAS